MTRKKNNIVKTIDTFTSIFILLNDALDTADIEAMGKHCDD